jgi:hypothetical protein
MDFRDEKKEALIKAYREQAGIKQFLIFFLFWGQNPDIYI